MCVHDTDARGLCTKNGAHCAFAHGAPDLRPPVLDARELLAPHQEQDDAAPNALDRERNLVSEDPKWQGTLSCSRVDLDDYISHDVLARVTRDV